jgi:hypothetical protein
VSTSFQFRAFLRVIEELAIEHCRHAPVFVGDRLLPIRQADNTKPPRSQSDARPPKVPFLIGAAVKYCPRHLLDDPLFYGSVSGEIHDTSDAAHSLMSPERGRASDRRESLKSKTGCR